MIPHLIFNESRFVTLKSSSVCRVVIEVIIKTECYYVPIEIHRRSLIKKTQHGIKARLFCSKIMSSNKPIHENFQGQFTST